MRNRFLIAFVLFITLGYGAWGQFGVLLGYEIEGKYFDSDGVRLHYVEAGAGEPVILVHGYAMNIDLSWRRPGVLDALAQRYHVVAFDARGHGLSDKPHDPASYGLEQVDDIVRLMDHLGIARAHLVGQSMGALTVLKFLSRHPERVISAAPNVMGWARPDERNLATLDALVTSLESGNGLMPLFDRLEPAEGGMSYLTRRTLDTLVGYLNDERALIAMTKSLAELSITEEEVAANRVPVLTIIGSADPMLEDVHLLHAAMPRHEMAVVPGADHFYVTGRPEFMSMLLGWLASHEASGATQVEAQ